MSDTILVVSSCTATKADAAAPAEELYRGRHHLRLMEGVDFYRGARGDDALDLYILSAGHGFVHGGCPLEPYDETFSGLGKADIQARGDRLGVPGDMRRLLRGPWAMTIVALPAAYLTACRLGGKASAGVGAISPTLFICGAAAAREIPWPTLVIGEEDTRRFRVGLTGLAGAVAARVLEVAAEVRPDDFDALVELLAREGTRAL